MSFSSFGLPAVLINTLESLNFVTPTPIQTVAIPAILDRKDVLGIAQTGSGKTASYVLPILSNLQSQTEVKNRHVSVLVLVPTRELAVQVNNVFQQFSANLPTRIKTMAVYGGVSVNPQMIALQGVNVLVATPGRLLELIDSKAVHLDSVETLVLDEADKMLNLGFKDEMDRIFSLLPKRRQNCLFSATLSSDVNSINDLLLTDAVVIKIEVEENAIDLINQQAYAVSDERKGPLLRHLIKSNNWHQVLIFTSSAKKADNVANKLTNNGIEARAIHSNKSQSARTQALSKFKLGKVRVLVATDLLARGIDIEFLPYVVNYELPRSPKDYIHRIGRTGRAEASGEAISLITPEEEHHFRVIQKKMGKRLTLIETDQLDLSGQ